MVRPCGLAPTSLAGAIADPPGNGRLLTRVLIAEDDPDIMALIALALGRFGGMAVTCCADGRAALEGVTSVWPQLVLLDVMMPELDGLETLARLRADPRTAAIPVVFLTARVQPQDRELYLARGALGVIAKPFDPLTLAQQLRWLHGDAGRPAR
jgi:two-component system, OmpR family, response regulator